MNFVSLFSGIGGFDIALENAGMTCTAQVEFDPKCQEVLAKHWPNVERFPDVRTVTAADIGSPDLICGGYPCFIAGTQVLTTKGYLSIEDIEVGDIVLTHLGRWRSVTSTMSREARTTRTIKAQGVPTITTTDEHPFWARQRYSEWDNAQRSMKRVWDDPRWIDAEKLDSDSFISQVLPKEDLPIPTCEDVTQDEDFYWLVGRYLGDGWRTLQGRKGGVKICCSEQEADELQRRIAAVFDKLYAPTKERTVIKYHISRGGFYHWLEDFGAGAEGKRIPAWVYSLPKLHMSALLEGYLSADGHATPTGVRGTTVSRALALGIALLAQKARGVVASVHFVPMPPTCVIEGRTVNQKPFYQVAIPGRNRSAFIEGQYGWKKVRSNIGSGPATVFNISVQEDESYVADGAIVHNCQDLSVAGHRAGLAGERSGLFYEFMRIVAETTPRWVLIENVPGLLSSNGGRDMGANLGTLAKLGYGFAYSVLDAQNFGVPQRRRRVFIVGCLGDPARAAAVLFDAESGSGNPPPSRKSKQDTAYTLGASAKADRGESANLVVSQGSNPVVTEDFASPLKGDGGSSSGEYVTVPPTDDLSQEQAWDLARPLTTAVGGPDGYSGGDNLVLAEEAVSILENGDASVFEQNHAYTLTCVGGKVGQGYSAVRQGMQVRRLTPIECERLQGFPDDHTEGQSMTARYKQLGNAVCVPVVEWVAKRIVAVSG